MRLVTFSPNGSGTIVIDDDAGDDEIARVMLLDAKEPDGNGSKRRIVKNEKVDEPKKHTKRR